ncbi:hypothetical protein V5799_024882, partial [Amblyomma americanum]
FERWRCQGLPSVGGDRVTSTNFAFLVWRPDAWYDARWSGRQDRQESEGDDLSKDLHDEADANGAVGDDGAADAACLVQFSRGGVARGSQVSVATG